MRDTLIPVDAKVQCTDGYAGFVTAVVVDPVKQEVSHVVVKTSKDTDHAVHLDQVERTEHDTIYLNCTIDELHQMHEFTETHYVKSENPDYSMYQSGSYQSPYVTNVREDYVPEEEECVPAGELAVHRGTKVAATDGNVGVLEEFVIDAKTGKVSHFILRKGHLWGKRDITIPVTAIDYSEGDIVYLKLDKAAIDDLPSVSVKRHYHS
jgi:sporulation protein YlmC with PRC-barrel domain